jgi:hypothetical protein
LRNPLRSFDTLCIMYDMTYVEACLSLRPSLSMYVHCWFYMTVTSTLHSCLVTFLLYGLNYCRMQTIGSSFWPFATAELSNGVSSSVSLRFLLHFIFLWLVLLHRMGCVGLYLLLLVVFLWVAVRSLSILHIEECCYFEMTLFWL